MRNFPRTSFPLLLCILVVILLADCARRGGEEENGNGRAPLVDVRCARVTTGNALRTVTATGRTDLLRREKIFAPVGGVILELRVLEGSVVRSGEEVAVIRTRESQAAIAGAEELARSAKDDRQRAEAERAIQLAREGQNRVTVTARTGGVVSTRSVSAGEQVAENAELLSIDDLSSLVFIADVPLNDLALIRPGLRCGIRLAAAQGREIPASVDALLPQSDPQSQTAPVRLRLGVNVGRALRPGMAGTARIVTGTRRNVLLVPRAALLRDDETNSYSVRIVTPDSRALAIPVETDTPGDSLVPVSSPALRAGMRVIVEGQYALPDSTRVSVRNADGR